MKKKNSKLIKYFIIIIIVLLVLISIIMIYKNLFANSDGNRYAGIENYKLSNDEINAVTENLNELENIDNIDIYVNSKIIKIFIKLTDDVNFDKVKDISNQALNDFSEKNLEYYDVEIFVDSKSEESEIYPQIGYKHKTSNEFSW